MSLATVPLLGSTKVVAIGDPDAIVRGRPAEFRQQGLSLATRPTALAALLEVGRDRTAVVLVPTDLSDMPFVEFVDVLRSLAHVHVIAGIAQGCNSQDVSELFDHGISSTVRLPATPARLAEAVLVTRAPEPPKALLLEMGDLTLDDSRHRVTWFGREVALAPRSFDMLRYLMLAHPRVVPLRELVGEFEDGANDHGIRTRVAIGRLRAAFADANPYKLNPIDTVHRIGYRLTP